MEITKKKATWKITAKPFHLGRLKAENTMEKVSFPKLSGGPRMFL